jgi:hypothetical protein
LVAVVGQEFFLFSWRLLLCDLVMAAYVLAVTFFLLLVRSATLSNKSAAARLGSHKQQACLALVVFTRDM